MSASDFDFPTMARALILGDRETVARKTREGLEESLDPKELIFKGLIPGMDVVGEKFRRNEYYVPQVLLSARAMYAGLDILKPLITASASGNDYVGVVVIGTAQGDLHDIGKNLVAMMLEGAGFKVANLGRDVAPEKFVQAVEEHGANIVGISALMTTTMPAMKRTIDALIKAGLRDRVKVMVGGAPVSQAFADEIGADGYAKDSTLAVVKAKALLGATAVARCRRVAGRCSSASGPGRSSCSTAATGPSSSRPGSSMGPARSCGTTPTPMSCRRSTRAISVRAVRSWRRTPLGAHVSS